MIDEKHLVPLLDQVLGFVDEALSDHETSQTKIADLTKRVVESERLLLEKVASVKAEVFPAASIDHTIERLVDLRILRPEDGAKVAAEIREKPAQALTLLEKISESLLFPHEGMGIPKGTGPADTFDLDGWTDFAAGRPVQVK